MGLVITFGLGIFILIGAMLVFIFKNSTKLIEFSIGIAFSIMSLLLIFEIVPEAYELLGDSVNKALTYGILVMGVIIGFVVLKILDIFIPDHEHKEHDDHEDKEVKNNLYHIGIVASIAIILHNIIEGMALYGAVSSSIITGILMCLGVGLHNIPLGMTITSTMYHSKKDLKRTILLLIPVVLSTFFGGLLMFIFSKELLNNLVLGVLLSLTSGMLVYIIILELFPHIKEAHNKKSAYIGFLLGIIFFCVSMFIG